MFSIVTLQAKHTIAHMTRPPARALKVSKNECVVTKCPHAVTRMKGRKFPIWTEKSLMAYLKVK